MVEIIRWKLRFANFLKAFKKLKEAVDNINNNLWTEQAVKDSKTSDLLSEMIKEGLIQRFEYTHELAWNVMKDYAFDQGNDKVGGSKDTTREAFLLQIISNGEVWMDMIRSRNKTSHTYNPETVEEIYNKILSAYFPAFAEFKKTMQEKISTAK